MPWKFPEFWKQKLSFVVMHIRTCMSMTRKEMLCLSLSKFLRNIFIYLFLKFLTLRQISFNTIKFYVTSFPKKDGLPVNSQIKMSLNQTSSKFLQPIMHILNLRHSIIIFHCFLNSYIVEVTIHKFDLYLSPFEKIF